MFGFDWTGDGEENLIDDLITMDILGLLDDKNESDEEDKKDEKIHILAPPKKTN